MTNNKYDVTASIPDFCDDFLQIQPTISIFGYESTTEFPSMPAFVTHFSMKLACIEELNVNAETGFAERVIRYSLSSTSMRKFSLKHLQHKHIKKFVFHLSTCNPYSNAPVLLLTSPFIELGNAANEGITYAFSETSRAEIFVKTFTSVDENELSTLAELRISICLQNLLLFMLSNHFFVTTITQQAGNLYL